MSYQHLLDWFSRADQVDVEEGKLAYVRYRQVMEIFAERFGFPLDRTTAAFVALSPNTDYLSNLRSLVTVLDGLNVGTPDEEIKVSTYNHNRDRAIRYLRGEEAFFVKKRGRKIRSFYHNILFPESSPLVTVDGHMIAIWRDEEITMKQASPRGREYDDMEAATRKLAFAHLLRPCEMQAILWFTRKRFLNIKYDGQLGLFEDSTDKWGTLRLARELQPYGV